MLYHANTPAITLSVTANAAPNAALLRTTVFQVGKLGPRGVPVRLTRHRRSRGFDFGRPQDVIIRPCSSATASAPSVEAKKLSQCDIEKRCGLLRAYISRVEHGHTVPSVETLEKLARALEIPLYQLFYEGEEPPKLLHVQKRKTAEEIAWAVPARTRGS